MQKETKEKWLKALRSGEYRQGRGCLRNTDDDFCCLGVLADVCGVEWLNIPRSPVFAANFETDICRSDLPLSILPNSTQTILMSLNDAEAKSFQEIADWIEENIPAEG